jgi:hypothetical protein
MIQDARSHEIKNCILTFPFTLKHFLDLHTTALSAEYVVFGVELSHKYVYINTFFGKNENFVSIERVRDEVI